MAKKNLTTTDRSGKSLSSTSTPLSTTTIDKSGKITPNTELSEEERKEKFGEFFFLFFCFVCSQHVKIRSCELGQYYLCYIIFNVYYVPKKKNIFFK